MTELIKRLSVGDIIDRYTRARGLIERAYGSLDEAEALLTEAFGEGIHNYSVAKRDLARDIQKICRDCWDELIERLGVRRMMSVAAWDKLQADVKKDPPEITHENVEAMMRQFERRLPEYLEQAVAEVFDFLRPPNSKYKRNSEFEIGPRVVLVHYVERPIWGGMPWRINSYYQVRLSALENVFSALDGKGQTQRGHYSQVELAVRDCTGECRGETAYFEFSGHKNGNLHLKFRRLDLLDRLNKIAGGNRLRQKVAEAQSD